MNKKIYLAYGSHMDAEIMKNRCPDSEFFCKGKLKNYRLMFKECISNNFDEKLSGYVPTGNFATIESAENFEVPIILWKISEQDEKNLDKFEDYPEIYYKKEIFAETEQGNLIKTFTYIIHEEKNLGLPPDYYFDVIKNAYLKFDFDLKILEDALEFCR